MRLQVAFLLLERQCWLCEAPLIVEFLTLTLGRSSCERLLIGALWLPERQRLSCEKPLKVAFLTSTLRSSSCGRLLIDAFQLVERERSSHEMPRDRDVAVALIELSRLQKTLS